MDTNPLLLTLNRLNIVFACAAHVNVFKVVRENQRKLIQRLRQNPCLARSDFKYVTNRCYNRDRSWTSDLLNPFQEVMSN